jgi:hypothetical protein
MTTITRTTDPQGRVSLPKAFANTKILIEQISDTELRIRKAQVISEDELRFPEESVTRLSGRDWEQFLAILDNPPLPSKNLRRAVMEYARRQAQSKEQRYG